MLLSHCAYDCKIETVVFENVFKLIEFTSIESVTAGRELRATHDIWYVLPYVKLVTDI